MARSFFDTLRELRGGRTLEELTEKLADVVQAVKSNGGTGQVKLTLTIRPPKRGAAAARYLTIEDEVAFKMPQPDRGDTLFFTLADGSLTRNDPDQGRLDLRAVDETEVDEDTGEIIGRGA